MEYGKGGRNNKNYDGVKNSVKVIVLKALYGGKGTVRNKKYDSICITLCPMSGWATSRNAFK